MICSDALHISRRAIVENCGIIRDGIAADQKLRLVLRQDAFGHCASIVAETLSYFRSPGRSIAPVDEIAVATLEEAYALGVCATTICVLESIGAQDCRRVSGLLEAGLERGWTFTLSDYSAIEPLARVAERRGEVVRVEWAFQCRSNASSIEELDRLPRSPFLRIVSFRDELEFGTSSAHTSPLIIKGGKTQAHWMLGRSVQCKTAQRGGKTKYEAAPYLPGPYGLGGRRGINDGHGMAPLNPVLSWTTDVLAAVEVDAGDVLNFGAAVWKAPRKMRVGVANAGYSMGLVPELSGRARVKGDGCLMTVIGRVGHGTIYFDMSEYPASLSPREVTIIDADADSPCSADSLAALLNIDSHDLSTKLGQCLRRRPLNDALGVEMLEPDSVIN